MSELEFDPTIIRLARHVAQEVLTALAERPELSKRWLNQAEAAAYLGLGARALETQRRERRGPKFSRPTKSLVRYALSDLDDWLRRHIVDEATT